MFFQRQLLPITASHCSIKEKSILKFEHAELQLCVNEMTAIHQASKVALSALSLTLGSSSRKSWTVPKDGRPEARK